MSIIGSNILAGASGNQGYNLNNSLRFRSSASAYMTWLPISAGNRKTWTLSFWMKAGDLATDNQTMFSTSLANDRIGFQTSTNSREMVIYLGAGVALLATSQVFRDPSAWYHIVVAVDTTQATAANRIKVYVNGNQVTSFISSTYPTLNYDTGFGTSAYTQAIGRRQSTSNLYFDGYMTDINFIDGQALTPSSFGSTNSTTGVWQPAKYTGTYGTNGFYLNFSNTTSTTTLGYDSSPNGNNWTCNNISLTAGTTYDAMTDVPTNTSATVANYAVINPLTLRSGTGTVSVTTSNANLTWNFQTSGASPQNYMVSGTIGMSSGKWYWEVTPTTITATTGLLIGVGANPYSSTNFWSTNGNSTEYMYISNNGNKANNNVSSAYGATYTTNDVIGVALDMDAGTLTFYKNNVSQGTAYTGLSGTYFPFLACPSSAATDVVQVNFGQRPFTYTPPSGYVALNAYNLPDSTIVQGNKYMDATLYTGTGSAGTDVQTVVNAGQFKPDLVWTKSRSGAYSHHIGDSVRGIDKTLFSNTTGAEATYTYDIHAFNSNGFTVGNDGSQNTSGQTYVGWQWQAGQGTNTSNTSGSITSTVSVNTTAGFSVVTYTGTGSNATCGHGLGVIPSMVIWKNRTGTDTWIVYHSALTTSEYLVLASTAAKATYSGLFTGISSTLLPLNAASGAINASANNYVAYCWAAISGFSKTFSYTGNGSADGPFVYLGFRPKFIMIKRTDSTSNWFMESAPIPGYNQSNLELYAESSAAEGSTTGGGYDFLSNGFKVRIGSGYNPNVSNGTYIGMAWAENPFKNALAR